MSYGVGETVYVVQIDRWDEGVFKGKVIEVRDGKYRVKIDLRYMEVIGEMLTSKVTEKECFIYKKKEDAVNYFESEKRNRVDKHKEGMKDVQDVMVFCLEQDVTGYQDHSDDTKRFAVIEKMRELGYDYEGYYKNYGGYEVGKNRDKVSRKGIINWLKSEIWGMNRNLGLNWKEEVLDLVDQVEYLEGKRQAEVTERDCPEVPDYVKEYIHYCKGRGYSIVGALRVRESGYGEVNTEGFSRLGMFFMEQENQYSFIDAYRMYEYLESNIERKG